MLLYFTVSNQSTHDDDDDEGGSGGSQHLSDLMVILFKGGNPARTWSVRLD